MLFQPRLVTALVALFFTMPAVAEEPTIVDPFMGSEIIRQQYAVDFDVLGYMTLLDGEEAETAEIEGHFRSAIYSWPEGKAPIEIQRSFERALDEAGFDILVNAATPQFSPEQNALKALQEANRVDARGFSLAAQQVTIFPAHYITAVRTEDGKQTVFTLTISGNQPMYMMEEATTAAMEENTVEISAEALSTEIEEAGKAILYGVQFDTGSAVIRPSSAGSLQTIADVLSERDGQFYIVGHTDDTGGFDMNMRLSTARAAAIVEALVEEHGIDASRLQAGGVGPQVPLASNENDTGRQLNRRVELVERLEN